jgi:hypothetical protein
VDQIDKPAAVCQDVQWDHPGGIAGMIPETIDAICRIEYPRLNYFILALFFIPDHR